MKRLPGSFRFQRVFIQLKNFQLRNLVRKNISLSLRKIYKKQLKFPFMILIEVTNDCMLNCIMCPHSKIKENTGYMHFDLFKKIIDECSHHYSLGYLVFSGMGEPLLHPKLLEMSRFAKSIGIPNIRLVTNAILLTKEKTLEIFDNSEFDEIAISLDATTERTYKKIKRSPNFKIAQENIVYFLNQKKKKKLWKPFIRLHILKMGETVFEISDFLNKWSNLLGIGDYILIKDVHTFAGQVEDRRLEEQIYLGERLPCRQLWEFLYISWNGDVMPCCMDVFKKMKIGNVYKHSLKELFNSNFIKKIRRIHLKGRYEEISLCRDCGNWWYLGKEPKKK